MGFVLALPWEDEPVSGFGWEGEDNFSRRFASSSEEEADKDGPWVTNSNSADCCSGVHDVINDDNFFIEVCHPSGAAELQTSNLVG